jgi:hypothetical protein
MLAVLCVGGAPVAKGDERPLPTPTSELIIAAAAAAEEAARLTEDADRCPPGSLKGRRS